MLDFVTKEELNLITEKIIGAAIEVHKYLGPGLFEQAYEKCLCQEFELRRINFEKQKYMPVSYKGQTIDCSYRIDLIVESKVIVELKSVSSILPIHKLQILNYLKLSNMLLGLIINFNVPKLKEGIKRVING